MRAFLFTTFLATTASALLQTVQVAGSGTLTFTPDTLTAPVGSQVQFSFYPRNHSVVSSAYGSPCQPDGRIFSGYEAVGMGPGVSSREKEARERCGVLMMNGMLAAGVYGYDQ